MKEATPGKGTTIRTKGATPQPFRKASSNLKKGGGNWRDKGGAEKRSDFGSNEEGGRPSLFERMVMIGGEKRIDPDRKKKAESPGQTR